MQQAVTQVIEKNGNTVKPIVWSCNLEECAKEYYAFAKEADNCPEMGDTIDVTNAIKRYSKFMMLQNKHQDVLLVPPFDVKIVWLAHMIRVEMYRKDCESSFGRIVDSHVLESTFRTQASLPRTQELWKAAYGSELKYEYQPGARRVNIPGTVLDGKNFVPSITVKDVVADRKWVTDLEASQRGFSFTDSFVHNAKTAYDMYMCFLSTRLDCTLGPPVTVDLIWHAHMCNPLRYDADCNRLVGRVVMHSPWPPEGGTTEEVERQFVNEFGMQMSEITSGMVDIATPPAAAEETPGGPAPVIAPVAPVSPAPRLGPKNLTIRVAKTRNFPSGDRYIAITVMFNGVRAWAFKTRTLKKTANPDFSGTFAAMLASAPKSGDHILIQCFSDGLLSSSIDGEFRIDLATVKSGEQWYRVQPQAGKKPKLPDGEVEVVVTIADLQPPVEVDCDIAPPIHTRMCDVSPPKPKPDHDVEPQHRKCKIAPVRPKPPVMCSVKRPTPTPRPPRPPVQVMCAIPPPQPEKMCRIAAPEPIPHVLCRVASPPRIPDPIRECEIAAPRNPPNRPVGGVAQCIADRVCTFAATGKTFADQTYYECATCGYSEGTALCSTCLIACHDGHDVSVARNGSCYCDCGSGEAPGGCCQAMNIPAGKSYSSRPVSRPVGAR